MATIIVNAGGDLQAAINSAAQGDTIQIDHTGTFTGNFVIPEKVGTAELLITTDGTIPAAGTRVAPADASQMPTIQAAVGGEPAIQFGLRAHHIRLVGLHCPNNPSGFGEIISIGYGDNTQTALADVPQTITIERCYIHGHATIGQKRGVGMNCGRVTIQDCYISDCKAAGQDTQAICGWNGPGPFQILNNYLEASGENFLLGGSDATIANLVPTGLVFQSNWCYKPPAWKGVGYTIKNLFELKNAQDCQITDNLFEYNWGGEGQSGYAILFTPRNSDNTNPWTVVQRCLFADNIIRHSGSGVEVLGSDDIFPSAQTNRITLRNNLFEDIDATAWDGDGRFVLLLREPDRITFTHNTCINTGSTTVYIVEGPSDHFVCTNNILLDNSLAIFGDESTPGNGTIAAQFPNSTFAKNIIVAAPSSTYPTDNYYPVDVAAVGFVNYAGGDYSLTNASPYHNGATDGTDPGYLANQLASYVLSTGWATFGCALPRGAATAGIEVEALETQTDIKTRWSDGSIRFAIVTAHIESDATYVLRHGPGAGGTFTPTWPSASVTCTIASVAYTADLPAFSGADAWLTGPLVRETRALVVPRAGAVEHPWLQVVFDVRSYVDGGHRVDVAVQNARNLAGADLVTYDVVVVVQGSTVFSKSSVTHHYGARWRQTFLTGGLVESDVVPDFTPFYQSNALPTYLTSVVNQDWVSDTAAFDILQFGDMSAAMGAPGGRPELGPYPSWTAQYLIWKTPNQRLHMLRNGNLAGSWSGYILEADGVGLLRLDDHPDFWLDARSPAPNGPANGFVGATFHIDATHVPSLSYVPYLVTGDRFYLDTLKVWANNILLQTYTGPAHGFGTDTDVDSNRRGAMGLLAPYATEPRGFGWGLRELADCAVATPDADPDKAYFLERVQNNLDWLNAYAPRTPNGILNPPFWEFDQGNLHLGYYAVTMWQSSYLTWAVDHASLHGFGPTAAFRDRVVTTMILLLTSDPALPPTYGASVYYPRVGTFVNGLHTPFTTMDAFFTAGYMGPSDSLDYNPGNSSARPLPPGPILGYYGSDYRLLLLMGARDGLPGAASALAWLMAYRSGGQGVLDDINFRSGFAIAPFTVIDIPAVPHSPSPFSGATDQAVDLTLTWVSEGATSYAIRLDTVTPPVTEPASVFPTASYDATGLAHNTLYYWRIIATNSDGSTTGPIWSFRTIAAATPPLTPHNPTPGDGAVDQAVDLTLRWTAEGATSYALRFDTVTPPVTVLASGLVVASYDVTGLTDSTRYYWRIIASNAAGNTTGPIWSFLTATPPVAPDVPSDPHPADGATQQPLALTLEWTSAHATRYQVTLDTVTPPVSVLATDLAVPQVATGALLRGTVYYWQVTAYNDLGDTLSTEGPIWSFTTADLTLSCPSPITAMIGMPFSAFLVAAGGTPPYTFVITAGSLPPGVTLNASTGELSGTPTAAGTYAYTAQVTDSP